VDVSIIDAAKRGSRQAQAALLNELQDPWFRLCVSMLRDAERARDATQETAVRFLKQLPQFRGESQIQTWSMGIAINVVREMKRSMARLPDTEPELLAAIPRAGIAPIEYASGAEEKSMLLASLSQLPERQREAIVLRFFEDLSVEETAVAMKCAEGTVKATVHQALRTLRTKLKKVL
jgi:RNA polymerase sigma factor (sigma-70 family)